ncbi:MAG: hypothetical protein IKY94_06500 [Lachnospiraceae bacterium]|nr:hypothetical protein [Clostridia bacterium]MBR4982190.1 hypothetical protein [Lachnospiraceae bacterium]
MTPPRPPMPILFGNKNQEVDIPDFLKKPQETKRTISDTILQELLKHEYRKGDIAGWARGFLTGILITLVIEAILETIGIIQFT